MAKPTLNPLNLRTEPWSRKQAPAVTTTPIVNSLDVASSRLAGGGTVVITGVRFRRNSDGSAPLVFFGSTPATGVVFTSTTSLSCTIPAALVVGSVDLRVQCDSESGTLLGGFLYFGGVVQSVSPSFAAVASGATVLIKGHNFAAGATFTIGGVAATGVTFIDDTQYGVTIPNHAAGYVDVVMTESDGGVSTLRNGFQYTSLARGTDIRRSPGVFINEMLGGQPNSADFLIDGMSNKPYFGEEIDITDEDDGNRVLFSGIIQMVDQIYEGQIDQLVWKCSATDFSYMLNKYRPFGTYTAVPANLVVQDLLTKYAHPDFRDFTFIQTNLALITVAFDGTKTFSECLDLIAQAIGGGRWKFDYNRKVHFFHPQLDVNIVVPPSAGVGADFTASVLSVGGLTGTLVPFPAGYYAIRSTFLYSNGAESRLGPASNIVGFDGTKFIHVASLAIGLNPSGSITCIGRKIYYYKGSSPLASGWTVTDNVTTTLDLTPAMDDGATVQNNSGDPVTVQDTGSSGTTAASPSAPDPTTNPLHTLQVQGSGKRLLFGGTNSTLTGTPKNALFVEWNPIYGDYIFAISVIYPNGVESLLLEQNTTQILAIGDLFVPGGWTYDDGKHYFARGYDAWFPGSNVFAGFGASKPIAWKVYYKVFPIPLTAGASGGGTTFGLSDIEQSLDTQSWKFLATVPYFEALTGPGPLDGTPIDPTTSSTLNTSMAIAASTDLGVEPQLNPDSPLQTLMWPNPDGPYLENDDPPEDITNDSTLLLHEDSQSQPFVSSEDGSQLRNRVKVYGSGSTTTADGGVGDTVLQIADTNAFGVTGGTVITSTGLILDFFSVSSPETGQSNILLSAPLQQAVPSGTVVQYFCQVEDLQSQRDRGKLELDASGNPTDGVHEYVISDPSLQSTQQLYLRAHAELSVFSRPITTVRYATRDYRSHPGQIVHVDMSDPPCHGDFLIQSVMIDQIRDGGEQISPRYTVVATSALFDLTRFLMTLATSPGASVGGGGSQVGVVASATAQAAAAAAAGSTTGILANRRQMWWNKADGNLFSATLTPTGSAAVSQTGGTSVFDSDGWWARPSTNVAVVHVSAPSAFTSLELLPKAVFRIRTPSSVVMQAPLRILVSLNETFALVDTDTPALTSQTGIYVRYSTAAGDGGWVIQTVGRGGRTVTATGVPVAPSTIYTITIAVTNVAGVITATVTINGVATSVTTNLSQGIALGPEILIDKTVVTTSTFIDVASVYVESN